MKNIKIVAVILLLFCFMAQGASAQQSGFTVTVTDTDGRPVINVPVRLTTCKSAFTIKTNQQGKAFTDKEMCVNTRLTINSKFYVAKDTLIGEIVRHVSVTLTPKIHDISEVSVKAYRRTAKSDAEKTIYNINKDGFLENTRANKALQFLPGVAAVGDTYIIQGKSQSARIKIDGVAASAEDLKTVNIADIAHVEVREISPDDNSNSAGEINVVRKRQQAPKLYASLSGTQNIIHRSFRTYDEFQFQNKQWDVNMYVNYVSSDQKIVSDVSRYYTDDLSVSHIKERRYHDATQFSAAMRIGYYPVSGKYQVTARLSHSSNKADIFALSEHDNGDQWQKNTKENANAYSGLVNYVYNWNKNNRLVLKGNFMSYEYTNSNPWYESEMLEYTGEAVSEHHHVKWLGDDNVSIGFKSVFRRNHLSVPQRWSYAIHRLYLTDFHKWSKRWSTYLILKGETDNMGTTRKYDFLPSLRVNYDLGKHGNLSAYYQRNVLRPSVDYLNADTLYVSDYNQVVGNIGLGYEHRDNVSLSYNRQIKTSFLTLSLSYEHRKDIIGAACMDQDNYNVKTYENLGDGKTVMMTVGLTQRFIKNRLNLSIVAGGLYNHYGLCGDFAQFASMLPVHGWGYTATLNGSYLSTRKWQYSLTVYHKPRLYAFNSKEYKHPMVMASVNKYVWDNWLKLSLNFMNSLVYNWSSRSETLYRDMRQYFSRKIYMNEVSISATLYIGKKFRNRQEASGVDNNDLQLRL